MLICNTIIFGEISEPLKSDMCFLSQVRRLVVGNYLKKKTFSFFMGYL